MRVFFWGGGGCGNKLSYMKQLIVMVDWYASRKWFELPYRTPGCTISTPVGLYEAMEKYFSGFPVYQHNKLVTYSSHRNGYYIFTLITTKYLTME